MFNYIKEYFNLKLYNIDDVRVFVKAKWITEDEFKSITGQAFV